MWFLQCPRLTLSYVCKLSGRSSRISASEINYERLSFGSDVDESSAIGTFVAPEDRYVWIYARAKNPGVLFSVLKICCDELIWTLILPEWQHVAPPFFGQVVWNVFGVHLARGAEFLRAYGKASLSSARTLPHRSGAETRFQNVNECFELPVRNWFIASPLHGWKNWILTIIAHTS